MEEYITQFTEAIQRVLSEGYDITAGVWEIAVRGTRLEGLAIILLIAIAALLSERSLRAIFDATPRVQQYKGVVIGSMGLVAAGFIYRLKDAVVMAVAPDYALLLRAANAAQTSTSEVSSVVLPEVQTGFMASAFTIVGFLVVLIVLCASLLRCNFMDSGEGQ